MKKKNSFGRINDNVILFRVLHITHLFILMKISNNLKYLIDKRTFIQ